MLLHFTIRVTDAGGTETSIPVRVFVVDENEFAPTFTTQNIDLLVRGDGETGLVIGSLQAVDQDASKL